MGKIALIHNQLSGTTCVSNIFLDQYMPDANGEFVKVYLYLLRHSGTAASEISICRIADTFNHTEKDVMRALKYWEQAGLLSLSYDKDKSLTSISLLGYEPAAAHRPVPSNSFAVMPDTALVNSFAAAESAATAIPAAQKSSRKRKHTYTGEESAALKEREEVAQLLYITEKYFGRPLTGSETNTLLYFYDGLEFPAELIEYLIEYCVSKNHTSIRYIEKVALNWADQGITTVEQAKEASGLFNRDYFSVMKAFGISGRNPGKAEKDFIVKWTSEYGFTMDIILNACNRTIQTIHQPSFEYADTILSRWKKRGVKMLSEIQELDEEHSRTKSARQKSEASTPKNSFSNFQQRTYNFSELEKEMLANNQGGF